MFMFYNVTISEIFWVIIFHLFYYYLLFVFIIEEMWYVLAQGRDRNIRLHTSDFSEGGHYGDIYYPYSSNPTFKGINLEIKYTRT